MKLIVQARYVECNTHNVSVNSQSLLVFEAILDEARCDGAITYSCFIISWGYHTVLFPSCSKTPHIAGSQMERQIFPLPTWSIHVPDKVGIYEVGIKQHSMPFDLIPIKW